MDCYGLEHGIGSTNLVLSIKISLGWGALDIASSLSKYFYFFMFFGFYFLTAKSKLQRFSSFGQMKSQEKGEGDCNQWPPLDYGFSWSNLGCDLYCSSSCPRSLLKNG